MKKDNSKTELFDQIRVLKLNRHYRLGDVFYAKGMRWEHDRNVILSDPSFKNTILYQYLNTLGDIKSKKQDWNSLLTVLKNFSRPVKNGFCVQIRCGDIATDDDYHKQCFIFNQDLFINRIAQQLDKNVSSITIVAAMHYGANNLLNNRYSYTDLNYNTNRTLLSNLFSLIEQKFKLPINIHQNSSDDIKFIDDQFLELIFSGKCILDQGGFGNLVAQIRKKLEI